MKMIAYRGWLAIAAVLVFAAPPASGQGSALTPAQMKAFMGTWMISMTNPAGAQETVKIFEKDGIVAASVQLGKFPPSEVTGIVKDGDMLVFSTTRRENGQPIWVVMSLTLDGDTMKLAQMLEMSQTIKRGTGKKQVD
jgi:hypothetical protein